MMTKDFLELMKITQKYFKTLIFFNPMFLCFMFVYFRYHLYESE